MTFSEKKMEKRVELFSKLVVDILCFFGIVLIVLSFVENENVFCRICSFAIWSAAIYTYGTAIGNKAENLRSFILFLGAEVSGALLIASGIIAFIKQF